MAGSEDSLPPRVARSGSEILRRVGEAATQPSTHRTLSWSADGKSLFLSTQIGLEGRIEKLDIVTGRLTPVVTGFAPKFSSDRQFVAYRTVGGSVAVARASSNGFKRLAHLETEPPGAAAEGASPEYEWGPEGRQLVYRRFTRLTPADAHGDRFGRQPEIWIYDAATHQSRRVYEAPEEQPSKEGFINSAIGGVAMGRDGAVYFARGSGTREGGMAADLATLDSSGGALRVLAPKVGNYAAIEFPSPSPDGAYLVAGRSEAPAYFNYWVLSSYGALNLKSLAWVKFSGPLPWIWSETTSWTSDSRFVYYLCKAGVYVDTLCKADPSSGDVQPVRLDSNSDIESFAIEPGGKRIAWISHDGLDVVRVRVSGFPDVNPNTLWEGRRFDLRNIDPAIRKVVKWKSFDGLEFEGLLVLPAGYRFDHRLPLIVDIHGGATGGVRLAGQLFNSSPLEHEAWAAMGYATFLVDYRRGLVADPNIERIRRHPGMSLHEADAADVIAGIEQILNLGIADPKHIVGIGHSYGAIVLNQLVTQSSILSAAISKEGSFDFTDWDAFTAPESNPAQFATLLYLMRATPDTVKLWAVESSPARHAGRIETPLLLITVGNSDNQAGLGKCRAVKHFVDDINAHGGAASAVFFPDDDHVIHRASNVDAMASEVTSWLAYYLGAPSAQKPGLRVAPCTG